MFGWRGSYEIRALRGWGRIVGRKGEMWCSMVRSRRITVVIVVGGVQCQSRVNGDRRRRGLHWIGRHSDWKEVPRGVILRGIVGGVFFWRKRYRISIRQGGEVVWVIGRVGVRRDRHRGEGVEREGWGNAENLRKTRDSRVEMTIGPCQTQNRTRGASWPLRK